MWRNLPACVCTVCQLCNSVRVVPVQPLLMVHVCGHRAFYSLKKIGIDVDAVRMAVCIMRVVPARYAFVIHTKNPSNNDASEVCTLQNKQSFLPTSTAWATGAQALAMLCCMALAKPVSALQCNSFHVIFYSQLHWRNYPAHAASASLIIAGLACPCNRCSVRW